MGSVEKRRQQLPDGKLGQVTWRARYRDANGTPTVAQFYSPVRCGAVPGGKRDRSAARRVGRPSAPAHLIQRLG